MTGKVLIVAGVAVAILIVIYVILGRGKARTAKDEPRRSAAGGVKRNWLVGESGEVQGRSYHIGSRTVTIGRGVSNFVQITDNDASRVHCQMIPSPTGMQVKDLDSGNGTFVNGERVKVKLLADGDVIRVGRAAFRYHAQGEFTDHALQGGKAVGAKVNRPTQLGGVQTIGDMLRAALKAQNGDIDQAAANLGMTREKLLAACQKQGIDPDEFKPRG